MSQTNGVERRKYFRIPSSDVVSFSELNEGEKLGVSKDVSAGGIRFYATGVEIDPDAIIEVSFYVGETFVKAVGKVVHATEVDALTLDVGLQFVEIDPVAEAILRNHFDELPEKPLTGTDLS